MLDSNLQTCRRAYANQAHRACLQVADVKAALGRAKVMLMVAEREKRDLLLHCMPAPGADREDKRLYQEQVESNLWECEAAKGRVVRLSRRLEAMVKAGA